MHRTAYLEDEFVAVGVLLGNMWLIECVWSSYFPKILKLFYVTADNRNDVLKGPAYSVYKTFAMLSSIPFLEGKIGVPTRTQEELSTTQIRGKSMWRLWTWLLS